MARSMLYSRAVFASRSMAASTSPCTCPRPASCAAIVVGSEMSSATPVALPLNWAAICSVRARSRPVITTWSPSATSFFTSSSPIPDVPPTTTVVRSLIGFLQLFFQVVPVAREAVSVPGRHLRRLGFEPFNGGSHGGERVNAAHASPGDISGTQPELLAVEGGIHFAVGDQVGLFERMIVGAGLAVGVVLDHEHGREVGPEV